MCLLLFSHLDCKCIQQIESAKGLLDKLSFFVVYSVIHEYLFAKNDEIYFVQRFIAMIEIIAFSRLEHTDAHNIIDRTYCIKI